MKKILSILFLLFLAVNIFAQDNQDSAKEEYFEKHYRKTWDSLSEFEQYAIAFSSNLFQINKFYHLDFSAKSLSDESKENIKEVLEDSWDITDYDSLIETFDNLLTGGHSGAYKSLAALLDKYPKKSVLDIALAEELSVLEVSRLYFVRDSRNFLGFHDIEAWDLGRAITLMRWSIATGYITQEEAVERCLPIVEKLKKDYTCWYDYIVHYVQGRGFYGIYDCESMDLMIKATSADSVAHYYIPLDSLVFTGENADKEHTFTDYTFTITGMEDAKAWEKVQKLYAENQTEETLKSLCSLEQEEFAAYTDLFIDWKLELLSDYGTNRELVDFIESKKDYFDALIPGSDLYTFANYYYLRALNKIEKPERTLEVFVRLPQNYKGNIYFFYEYAFANYLMLSYCNTQTEYEYYKKQAITCFKILKENGFELSEVIESWINIVE